MTFSIKDKVGIITGAPGMGFWFAKDLLASGLRNVTIVDINEDAGNKSVSALRDEFGTDRAIFIKADVTVDEEFEEVFKETLKQFKNIDILINNAAIGEGSYWSKLIDVDLKGVIRGTLLGLNYISKYKTADSGLIVNVASIASLSLSPSIPFYSSTKTAVMQVSRCFGDTMHYNKTKVRVVAICPGATDTPLYRKTDLPQDITNLPLQQSSHVSKSLISLIRIAPTGSVWVIENGEDAYELEFPERYGTKKK